MPAAQQPSHPGGKPPPGTAPPPFLPHPRERAGVRKGISLPVGVSRWETRAAGRAAWRRELAKRRSPHTPHRRRSALARPPVPGPPLGARGEDLRSGGAGTAAGPPPPPTAHLGWAHGAAGSAGEARSPEERGRGGRCAERGCAESASRAVSARRAVRALRRGRRSRRVWSRSPDGQGSAAGRPGAAEAGDPEEAGQSRGPGAAQSRNLEQERSLEGTAAPGEREPQALRGDSVRARLLPAGRRDPRPLPPCPPAPSAHSGTD